MIPTQVINPHILKQFLELNEDILCRKFPETKISKNIGRPRIGLRWVLIAICVFARTQNIVWRDLPQKLNYCDFLIKERKLRAIPSKSTFHRVWMQVSEVNLNSWIRMIGYEDSRSSIKDLVIDSSGFELRPGSIWRHVKWTKTKISKTSSLFRKIHLAIALPSRTIVGIYSSEAKKSDCKAFGPLIIRVYKRLLTRIRRAHADKAYWDEKIVGYLCQERITPVIPCKANSKINGIYDFMDFQVRYQKKYPGIYKKNTKHYLRAEVEHVFGEVKLQYPILRDRYLHNKNKSLLCHFLWYNHKNRLRRLKIC